MILNDGKNHTGEGGYNMNQTLYTSRIFDTTNGNYVVMGGYNSDIFMALSLPKGYRFTGYEIVVANNMQGADGFGGWDRYDPQNKILYEAKDLTHNAAVTEDVAAQYSYEDLYEHCNDAALYSTIYNAINGGQDDNYLAVAKHRVNGVIDNNAWVMGTTNSNDDYVITRTSTSDDDMGNHLYFRLSHDDPASSTSGNWVGLTIKSITIYFSAEGDFTESVSTTNTTAFNGGKNYAKAPFETGKVDLGDINLDANGHYTYRVLAQKDLVAYNTLFQEDAVSGGALPDNPGEGGITAEKNGGEYYYGLKNNTYYVECPTSVMTTSGVETPVGFRIIGAKVNYTYGQSASAQSETVTHDVSTVSTYNTFYISAEGETYSRTWRSTGIFSGEWVYTSNGVQTYYLTSTAGMTTEESNKALWFMDDNGYIRLASSPNRYLKNGSNNLTIVESTGSPARYTINSNGQILQNGTTNMYIGLSTTNYNRTDYAQSIDRFQLINNPTYKALATEDGFTTKVYDTSSVTETINYGAFTPAPYTLTVYDKDGTSTVGEPINVSSTNQSGSVTLSNLNNDAIKFTISNLSSEVTNARALITVELTMQALDPYIKSMSVVCSDPQTNISGDDEHPVPLRISQDFTASDFSVNGGSFHFSLPDKCKGHEVAITFEDLRSDYADESYTQDKDGFNGSVVNFSRYNFVKSEHYNAFGVSNNNIYTNYSEAASPQLERLKVGTVGTTSFKFNNAEEVAAGSAQYYLEYPFSLETYQGSFNELKFTASGTTQSGTRYVFTTDETGYNIAPTTTTQHRLYAFYEMNISVQSATYTPEVHFVPVYDNTLNGSEATDAYYGAVVTATDSNGKPGYASTDDIFKLIGGAVSKQTESGVVTESVEGQEVTIGSYTGKDSKLTSAKQLIYLDFSGLAGVFQVTTAEQASMQDYSNSNAANCLIFLPVGASAPNDNVAAKTQSGSFRAANNIVLTDKEPFYSPYDITIPDTKMASYKRLVTLDKYGKVQNASLLMPFAVTIDADGVHTNEDGSTFTLYNMQPENSLSVSAEDELVTSYYIPATKKMGNVSQANYPYIVRLDNVDNDPNHDYSFVVSQKGATIKATTGMNSDYTITGDEATGSVDKGVAAGNYKFTGIGTLAGIHVKKSDGIFYFAKNQFWSSLDLNRPNVSIYPFRAYYKTEQTANATPSSLQVFFGKNENTFEDAIRDLQEKQMDMSVRAGRGTLTITSATDNQVRINGISGVSHYNLNLGAGETKTVSVPAGIYVVNGVKILVK